MLLTILLNLAALLCRGTFGSIDYFKSVNLSQTPCSLNQHCVSYQALICGTITYLNVTNCALANENDQVRSTSLDLDPTSFNLIESNMENLIKLIQIVYFTRPPKYPLDLSIEYAQGFDLEFFQPLKTMHRLDGFPNHTSFVFEYGVFDFYNKKKPLNTPETCNSQTYQVLLTQSGENVFSVFSTIQLSRTTFTNKLCKYIFQNVSITKLSIDTHKFEFFESLTQQSESINSTIGELQLDSIYKLDLAKSLDPDVFRQIRKLTVSDCVLHKIPDEMFKQRFHALRSLNLELVNLNGVMHAGIAWIKYLNYNREPIDLMVSFLETNKTRSLNSTQRAINGFKDYGVEIIFPTSSSLVWANYSKSIYPYIHYQFPDSDFCLFYQTPLERLVLVQITGLGNISCTVAWLYRYQHFYSTVNLKPLNPSQIPSHCNFTKSIELCNLTTVNLYHDDPYFVFYFLDQRLQSVKSVLIGYLGPFSSAFGFTSNMLILLTIAYNHKRRKEIRMMPKSKDQEIVMLEQFLYKYILMSAILNSIYSLMFLLDSSIPCSQSKRFDYISSTSTCVIKSYFVDTSGSVLKLMSNLSYLQMSINRFLLVGKDHPEWLIKLSQIKIKTFFLASFSFSLLLSLIVYFQNAFFVFNTDGVGADYSSDSSNSLYYMGGLRSEFYRDIISKTTQVPLLSSFILIHDLFSYFLFCIFSLILDVLTVKKLHDALKDKIKLKGKSERQKSRESERKSIMMVVFSSLTNFLFRAPELISIIFFYIVLNDGGYVFKMLCWSYFDCLIFVDFSKVFYTMSLCFHLILYIKFNSVFKISFIVLIQNFCKNCFCFSPNKQ